MLFMVIFREIFMVYSFLFFEYQAMPSFLALYLVSFFHIFRSIALHTHILFLLEVHVYTIISKNAHRRLKCHSFSVRCINQVKEILVKLIYCPFEDL